MRRCRQDRDVTALVRSGENTIAAVASHARADTPAGLIGAVKIEFESGDPLLFQSGNGWRAAMKVEAGWEKPGYLDSAWQAAKVLGDYGMAPWKDAGYMEAHRLPARMLRKEFTVDKKVRRATVYFAGLGTSELYLNGVKVGDAVLSPGLTDYDKHVLYVTYDVTRQVAQGRNAAGIMLGNGRYYAPRSREPIGTRDFGYPKAKLQLNVEYEDGSRLSVASDESWKLTANGPIRANNEYDGEEYDARMEAAGWSRAGFDDSKWEAAHVVGAPAGVLAAQMAEPLRVTETLKPVSVKKLQAGRVHLRYGAEPGGLVPAAGERSQGHTGNAATFGDAGAGRLAIPREPAQREGDRHLHAEGRRSGSLGAAFHLSRIPLCGGHGLSGGADGGIARRAGGARRHGARRRVHQFQRTAEQDSPQHVLGHSR